ncbi:MAG: lipoprotein ABC transporter permease [Clostridium sp.]|jgi:putative ABC transport system permease protein|nr:lipoprotein ABC transporter permease [Clostridium sp.]
MNVFVLAVRNVRRNCKDYSVYFLTIILGVSMFYIFNSIGSQRVMFAGAQDEAIATVGIERLMDGLSVFVAAVLGFLILYANAFLIRRRKQELGLCILLGMKKGRISAVLICETFLIGLLSLAAGLALGVFLSQGMALVTAKMLGVSVSHYAFVFSGTALTKSTCYFGTAFFIVILFHTVHVSRQKLLHLLYAGERKVCLAAMPLWTSVLLFCVSAAMLLVSYGMILNVGIVGASSEGRTKIQTVSMLMGTAGTFLFFFSLSGFFLKLVSGMKGVYFKDLNLLTVKQLNRNIHAAWISMSFLCLLLFLALSAISAGSSLSAAIREYRSDEVPVAAGVSYMTVYLGMTFLLTCASILAIGQLSEASDHQERYRLLSKLGANERMIAGSVLRQVLITFSAPLALAVVHWLVAMKLVSGLVEVLGDFHLFSRSLTAGAVILLLYGGYLMMTYQNAKKIILNALQNRLDGRRCHR